jgi:hypothetical protein
VEADGREEVMTSLESEDDVHHHRQDEDEDADEDR